MCTNMSVNHVLEKSADLLYGELPVQQMQPLMSSSATTLGKTAASRSEHARAGSLS